MQSIIEHASNSELEVCGFVFVEDRSPDKFGETILNTRGYCACTRDHRSVLLL